MGSYVLSGYAVCTSVCICVCLLLGGTILLMLIALGSSQRNQHRNSLLQCLWLGEIPFT